MTRPRTRDLVATASDGTRIAATLHGDGGVPLLMIPGLGATRVVYDPVVDLLVDRGLRPLVVDNRGVGDSGVPEGPYSMGELAADAVAVLDAAGLGSAHVFGASMGGMVAQWVAIDHGHRVDRLALGCTSPGRSHAVKADPASTAKLLGAGARTPAEAYRIACEVLYSERFRAEHPDFVEDRIRDRAARPVSPRGFAAQRAASWAHDPWEALPRVAAPTLVLHGTLDLVMPVRNGELLAARIPGAEWGPLAGAGHLFFHEDPGWFADAVSAFLLG